MENNNIQMPVGSLSYSALTQLLRNPLIFKLKYIFGVYDGKTSVSGMIGRAGHEALKTYYGGNPDVPAVIGDDNKRQWVARDIGLKYLETFPDSAIEYGKTGSREEMLKGYAQAMDFYFAEEPKYHKVLMCEEKMDAELRTLEGDVLPLPASGVPDLVVENEDGSVDIIDTKFVKTFTDYETEDYIKIVQAQFLFHLLIAAKGIKASRILFREIKRTANKEGGNQIRDYVIPFNHDQYRVIFYNLYKDVVKFLSNPNAIFLPNLSDPFDGEQAGLLYAQGLINSDMSDVEVMHKVKDVAFTSKKFITSRLDRAENKHLNPEEKVKLRLAEFGIPVEPVETETGPSVTRYRFKVSAGVRMSTIKKHIDDIKLALEAKGEVRVLAPIPGTSLIGVEVENQTRASNKLDQKHLLIGTLSLPIGVSVEGEVVRVELNEMPHLLIAGATGSGKSVLLHSIIASLSKQMSPQGLQLVLIDPKRVELSAFANLPHLRSKVVYEYEDGLRQLLELSDEMEARYKVLEKSGKRDIAAYNESKRDQKKKMPYIVVVIDEFADFIIRSRMAEKRKKDQGPTAEQAIVRLAQMARAVGIHLVIATQRPSTDVITGLIKANFPTRIALTTASPVDSEVILGQRGAEKLAGKGDMLFVCPALRGIKRLQGFHYE